MGRDRRARTVWLGSALLAGAVVLGLLAVQSAANTPTVRTEAVPAQLALPPTTVPDAPARPAPTTTPVPAAAEPSGPPSTQPSRPAQATATPATTLPVSPLAGELPPRQSVVIEAAGPVVAPSALRIGALALSVPVRGVGVEPDGQLEIPDETEVGWYRLGSSPTRPGATVLAGHVSWNDTIGPFFRLADLEPGALIELELSDGSVREYVAVERAQYGKLALPQDRIWTQAGPETLVLITCGGEFNRQIRRYADNIVVYAVPTEPAPAPTG